MAILPGRRPGTPPLAARQLLASAGAAVLLGTLLTTLLYRGPPPHPELTRPAASASSFDPGGRWSDTFWATACHQQRHFPYKAAQSAGVDVSIAGFLFKKWFRGVCNGTFVELGAYDGLTFSNSLFFERHMGWRGLCLEGSPGLASKLKSNRPACVSHNVAITNASQAQRGKVHYWEISGYPAALSGIAEFYSPAHAARIDEEMAADPSSVRRVVELEATTLPALAARHGLRRVDFFSLDTEGSELAILQSFDFEALPVYVWVIEDNGYGQMPQIEALLKQNGYSLALRDERDLFFVNPRHAPHVRPPTLAEWWFGGGPPGGER